MTFSMLVLTRKTYESIIIDGRIEVKLLRIKSTNEVSIGIAAPSDVTVHRMEIHEQLQRKRNESRPSALDPSTHK